MSNKRIKDFREMTIEQIHENDLLIIRSTSEQSTNKITIRDFCNSIIPLDSVTQVNGKEGNVILTTADIPELENLYYTSARAKNDLIINSMAGDEIDMAPGVQSVVDYTENKLDEMIDNIEEFTIDYVSENGLPDQTDNEGKFLKTDGIDASWEQIDDNDIFVTANNLNKNLKDVIEDGDLDKVFQWPAFGDINAQIDLINEIKKLELPVGFIIEFAGDIPPANFLIANGQAISRTTYAELFSVIGTKYGAGDGSTTFNLPNLNNEFGRYTTNTSLIGNKHGHSTARPTTAFSTGASGAHTHANTNSIENQLNFSGEVILPNGKDALSTTEDFIRSYSGNYLLLRDATALSSRIELTTVNVGTPNNVDFDLSSSTSSGSTSSATHSHTITAGGDSETAPRHIMLLACIKVY